MEAVIFEKLRSLIERESGIHLTDEKRTLLSNRVQKRLRALNLPSVERYMEIIELDVSGEELVQLIDVVSTNVTYFWREHEHFEKLSRVLREYEQQGKHKIRIWCAASSSGEEPYGIAMVAQGSLRTAGCDFKILATDICTKVLRKAVVGRYQEKQLEKLPAELRQRYLSKIETDDELCWEVAQPIKNMVLFKKLNLSQFPYPLKGPLDIIFCRNVMIYFDLPLRQKIAEEFFRLLAPGGLLFLSLSENLLGFPHRFQSYSPAVFQKPVQLVLGRGG